MLRTTNDLVRLAIAGGGMIVSAETKTTSDLVRIAIAAKGKGKGKVIFKNLNMRTTDDLVRIAIAGGDNVILDLT